MALLVENPLDTNCEGIVFAPRLLGISYAIRVSDRVLLLLLLFFFLSNIIIFYCGPRGTEATRRLNLLCSLTEDSGGENI